MHFEKFAGLKLLKNWRCYATGCGFPCRLLTKILNILKKARVPVVVVKQTGREQLNTKERRIALILAFF
jgi:hypothetical protein